ncbi:hypothetical protein OIU34_18790 [Pararhizobium sp. BT-229]|uniref:hypothetical protein n=1 Tax=Pararhizobium sp. BT-229 TaxID=2986923 RepID=UPI0021F71399|nr:hypothetical protein [Pararhizobium sp. BT-229]MCV9963928.1 hypothetical protein [Pararhizobium sp. BT-229]
MAFDLDMAGPTDHEMQVAERCDVKISELENALGRLNDDRLSSVVGPDHAAWLVDAEMVQSELEFWRAKKARVAGYVGRHEGRGGYWLVPYEPSARALRLANGLTDLADISASPRNMESTLSEIGLAVRIAIEADGIPVMQSSQAPGVAEGIDLDARLAERKDILVELDNTRSDFVKLAARYLELRKGVEGRTAKESEEARYLVDRERELDRYFAIASLEGPLEASISSWRDLLDKART